MVAPSKHIRVTDKQLASTLPFLSRWELDVVPMVSRQFGVIYERGAPFYHRRTIDLFTRNGPNNNNLSVKTAYLLRLANGITRCIGVRPDYSSSVQLTDDELQLLLLAEPTLCARFSAICVQESKTGDNYLDEFASLCRGIVELKAHAYVRELPQGRALFANCSSFIVGGQRLLLDWADVLRHLGASSEAELRCPTIRLNPSRCQGISFKGILDFLFTPPSAGWEKKVFELNFIKDSQGFTPAHLLQDLDERLATIPAGQLPRFSLRLLLAMSKYVEETPLVGEFELLDQQALSPTAAGKGDSLADNSQEKQHSCKFVAIVEKDTYYEQEIEIKVECF